MFRRFASRILTLAPLLARSHTFFTALKPVVPQIGMFKPIAAATGLASVRAFASAADESIKELTKPEEWDEYAKKVSDEKPVIVEFFAKYDPISPSILEAMFRGWGRAQK